MAGLSRGYVQVYTGNGKGKTTAALGLAVRAACAGLRVHIGQFMKGRDYAELALNKHFNKQVVVEQYGTPRLLCQGEEPSAQDRSRARAGVDRLLEILRAGAHDLVIADELCVTMHLGLLTVADGLRLLDARPQHVELVLTGRYAPPEILERADLITEMRDVKHYYEQGVLARRGIES